MDFKPVVTISWELLFQIINTVILFLVLKKLLFKPVLNIIEKRENMIQDDLAAGAKAKNEGIALRKEYEEKVSGTAEVRQLFKFSKVGTIAGSFVQDGIIKQNSKARVVRDGIVVYDGNIASLQRGKDRVNEVKKGIECGITIENFSDIKENDIIEAYVVEEIKR